MTANLNSPAGLNVCGFRVRNLMSRVLTIWLLILLPFQMSAATAERETWVEALAPEFATDGRAVLRAFKPLAESVRASVVALSVNGTNVALGPSSIPTDSSSPKPVNSRQAN